MSESVTYLSDILRVSVKKSKKGNEYKCLEVAVDGEGDWQFVCFLK